MLKNFKKAFTLKHFVNKGFTLIELLVVIGIMAVIAAGVVALIDPVEKTRQANDANTQNAVGQTATALQAYAAQQTDGSYPTTAQGIAYLSTVGELTVIPTYSNGVAATYTNAAAAAPYTGPVVVYHQLLSKKYIQGKCAGAATTYWFWRDLNGKACGACVVPTTATACAW